ncbi:MAG: type II toxin-antitoxin system YafQ family toxin [Oscillospiraceae bacterium]|nr:type II toxin-antitoxin system YafQ family toxin [Oscillospiraceae bacterium]MCD8066979.1 type II toxin-antitoxin system YafQ family toxin [Oscillospiraceae bacterium]
MYEVVPSARFRRDYKLAVKRGCNMKLLQEVVDILAAGETLDAKYRDHALSGNFNGVRECHISPDWLLLYDINGTELALLLLRTGTHSDIF